MYCFKTQARGASLLLSLALCLGCLSCEKFFEPKGEGSIIIGFSQSYYQQTKAEGSVPDSTDFILKVSDEKGKEIYNGKFGNSPEKLLVASGKYKISVRSVEFSKPKFSEPQYGDDKEVTVSSGQQIKVTMKCVQVNSGIRLKIASDFLTSYPNGTLSVSSAEGKLNYNYRESRIAYFKPGKVTVVLNDSGVSSDLFSRVLDPREILTVNISAPGGSPEVSGRQISVMVDTSRTWLNEKFEIGGGNTDSGEELDGAMSVSLARNNIGKEDVWVYGYIVGCFNSSQSNLTTEGPFSKDSNFAIAARQSVSEKSSCIAVELKKGDVRTDLNLKDNPDNLGKKVFLRGDIVEAYYGTVGLKNISEYRLD